MKVFLSYASEDSESAEQVMLSIAARGHEVFFDRSSLPAGATFEDRIEHAIATADAFVFLVSPHSVGPGGFALTELGIARKKWPRPGGRVLPVMLTPTDFSLLPAYLAAVTVLQPEGNVAAETAIAVEAMRRRWPPANLKWLAAATALVAAAGLAYIYRPAPEIVVKTRDPVRWERGFFDRPDRFNMIFDLANTGRRAANIVSAQIQTEPPSALETLSQGVEHSSAKPRVIESGGMATNHFVVTLTGARDAPFSWRICATQDTGVTNCGERQDWTPQGAFVPDDAFQVDPEISANAVLLAAAPDGFFVATRNPHRLHRIGMDGEIMHTLDLDAEPTTLLAQGDDLLIGTRGPDSVMRLDPATLGIEARVGIRFPPEILGAFDAPVSSTPVSIAKGGGRVWVVTRGGASAAGLIHMSEALADPVVPPWFKDIAYDLGGLHLVSGSQHAWGGQHAWGAVTNVTPASLYRLSPGAMKVFGGHDWDIVSCATDVLPVDDAILVPDCDGVVQRVGVGENDLSGRARLAHTFGYDSSASIWTEVHLRQDAAGEFAAYTVNEIRGSPMVPSRTFVTRLNAKKGLSLALEVGEARIIDLAIHGPIFMVILEDGDGKRQTLALDADP